ncbi:MAG: hypothetical protein AAGG11_19085 [Pseudomonadota bacterium]
MKVFLPEQDLIGRHARLRRWDVLNKMHNQVKEHILNFDPRRTLVAVALGTATLLRCRTDEVRIPGTGQTHIIAERRTNLLSRSRVQRFPAESANPSAPLVSSTGNPVTVHIFRIGSAPEGLVGDRFEQTHANKRRSNSSRYRIAFIGQLRID